MKFGWDPCNSLDRFQVKSAPREVSPKILKANEARSAPDIPEVGPGPYIQSNEYFLELKKLIFTLI